MPIWLIVGLVLFVGLGGWAIAAALAPGGAEPDQAGPGATGVIGGGPGEEILQTGPDGRPLAVTPGSGPGGGLSPGGTPVAGSSGPAPPGETSQPAVPPLTVSHEFVPSLLDSRITITITNPATTAQPWQHVGVQLTGVNLIFSNMTAGVQRSAKGGLQCFAAPDLTPVPAGASVDFTFEVTNLLGGIGKLELDPAVCA